MPGVKFNSLLIYTKVSAFLGALYDSNIMRRALVVCPATVLSHWIAELHEWAPKLRVVILHRCAYAFNAVSGSQGEKTQVSVPDSCVV